MDGSRGNYRRNRWILHGRTGTSRDVAISCDERLGSFLDSAIGKRDQLLVEVGNRGHGRNFAKIRLEGDFIPSGQLVDVELIGRDGDSLVGRAVAKGAQSA